MHLTRQKTFRALRIAFGLAWAVDACFKWTPSFLNGLPSMLASMAQGQPALVADWLNIWVKVVSVSPHSFSILVALIESALAICLIFDLFPKATYVTGFIFSLLVWGVGEGFGAPYIAGSTDIGAAIMYAFIFAALYGERYGSNRVAEPSRSAHEAERYTRIIKILSIVIVVLGALLAGPYLVIRNNTASSQDGTASMSPDMMQKMFYLEDTTAPIPTVDFTLARDVTDGWDLHILTTNFAFTPENINTAPIADQGHAHLYIDGALIVVFGPWYHIDGALLPPGTHTVSVSLNANDHSTFSYQNKPIQAARTIVVTPI